MSFSLDQATRLAEKDSAFRISGAHEYRNFTGAFGGWALATAVEAIWQTDGARGHLASINAIFLDAIGEEDLIVTSTLLSRRARTDFWRVEIVSTIAPDGGPVFSADLVFSMPRTSDLAFTSAMPDVPAPEDLDELSFPMGPKWIGRYQQRPVAGRPFTRNDRPRSVMWAREADGRALDAKGLAALSDTFVPRSFFLDTKPRMGSTVSFSLSVFASADDLAAIGTDYVLLEGDSDTVINGAYDQRGRLWSRTGQLIAVTNQIAFFR